MSQVPDLHLKKIFFAASEGDVTNECLSGSEAFIEGKCTHLTRVCKRESETVPTLDLATFDSFVHAMRLALVFDIASF